MRRFLAIMIVLIIFANLVFLQMKMDSSRNSFSQQKKPLLIFPKPSIVRALSLGHINIIADYYWLKTIQYLGGKIQEHEKPNHIWDYANFVTNLSPRFFEAYYYPSVIMIVFQLYPEKNIALLQKGIQNLPTNKDLFFLAGFVSYFFLDNHQQAADYFFKAAEYSGYYGYAILASRILAEKGNIDLSESLLKELAKGSENQRWSKEIQNMQKGLEQRKGLDFLDKKIELYYQEYGKYPEEIQDIVKSGLIAPNELPEDPFGGQYYIDRNTHKAKSTKEYYLGVFKPKEFQK
jgi:tetratricopeptide (TPR) repeat protein